MTLYQLALILGAVYIILSLGMFFMMRKANYKRPWFAFIPVLNVYKMVSMNYDHFKGSELTGGSVSPMNYYENRRYAGVFITLAYFISVMASSVIEETISPTDLTIEREPATNPIEFMFTGVTDVYAFLAIGAITFFMFRMFVNVKTEDPMNPIIIGIFIVGSVFSYGLTIVLLMYYIGLNPQYKYKISFVDQ